MVPPGPKPAVGVLPAIFLVLLLGPVAGCAGCGLSSVSWKGRVRAILVNQVGYETRLAKRALAANTSRRWQDRTFELVDVSTGRVVADVPPGAVVRDRLTRDRLQLVDFTWFEQPGTYQLRQGKLASAPFRIGHPVFRETIDILLHSYLYQRCGVALHDPVTGVRHAPCHTAPVTVARDDTYHRRGELLRVTGGWHDAGDYGRYASTTAVTAGRLLFLAEQFPDMAHDHVGIPESGNGVPDILDEAAVGVRWLLAMQRPDGGVYRKVAGRRWPPPGPPEQDTQPQFVYGVSSAETAKAAAVFAMAARLYARWDLELSSRALDAARAAWRFLEIHPGPMVDHHPDDDTGSGCYVTFVGPDRTVVQDDTRDRFWAAAELYLTTGAGSYRDWIEQVLPGLDYTLFGWRDPSAQGMLDLLLASSTPEAWRSHIRAALLARAGYLLEQVRHSGYRLTTTDFVWGSNRNAAEDGVTLALAYDYTGDGPYLDAAVAQADYLLGRNPFDTVFVTGVGTHSVRHLAHGYARFLGRVLPGFLVGGPNSEAQDGVARPGRGPLSWVDRADSYATNENAIDYNPSLITLLMMLTRLGGQGID